MRSETRDQVQAGAPWQAQVPARAQTRVRVRDRFGSAFTASVSVLFFEAVIGSIVFYVWMETQEVPALGYNLFNIFFLFVMGLIGVAAGAVGAVLLSVAVVMPLVAVAGWLGRTVSGRDVWWWIPLLAAAGGTLPGLVSASMVPAGFPENVSSGLIGWFMGAAALGVPALVVRRLVLPDRPRVSGIAMFGWVALYGTLGVVVTGALAGVALYAGIGYEPPRLTAERLAGTWSDGNGGRITFTADGKVTADGVKTFGFDDDRHDAGQPCTGAGTWVHHPGDGSWSQNVGVSVDACDGSLGPWEVFGTPEHPKLYVLVGDPDAWDLYILEPDDQPREEPVRD
ncbi:hypothetical protein ACFU8W_48555 [Streptomyces sp. NPDC057565]|uniref:hypothetical protein n=1 Tax=Streptomyces sp. NPDC057565 TaxID=3346169 RepID=UPI00369E3F84